MGTQRASALPFDSARTQALLSALIVFRLLPHGFRNADLCAHLAPLLGLTPADMTPGRMTTTRPPRCGVGSTNSTPP